MKVSTFLKSDAIANFLENWEKYHTFPPNRMNPNAGKWRYDFPPTITNMWGGSDNKYDPEQVHPLEVYNRLIANQPLNKRKIKRILKEGGYGKHPYTEMADRSESIGICDECDEENESLMLFGDESDDERFYLLCLSCLKVAAEKLTNAIESETREGV